MNNNKIYYIAHPYTPLNGITIEENLILCTQRCNHLLDLGYIVFSPITHSHQLHIKKEREAQFWYSMDLFLLRKLDGIILCPKWETSKGCQMEYELAIELGKEVLFYNEIIKEVEE